MTNGKNGNTRGHWKTGTRGRAERTGTMWRMSFVGTLRIHNASKPAVRRELGMLKRTED